MNELTWEAVKDFYQDKFGIDKWVVEVYADLDILTLCASGSTNKSIGDFLDIPVSTVNSIIKDVFEFPGWSIDLPLNPYRLFMSLSDDGQNRVIKFMQAFEEDVVMYPDLKGKSFTAYEICETLFDLERKIQDEWK